MEGRGGRDVEGRRGEGKGRGGGKWKGGTSSKVLGG